jgi:hypothetical protein
MGLEQNIFAAQDAVAEALQYTPQGSDNKGGKNKPDVKATRTYARQITVALQNRFTQGTGSVTNLKGILHCATAARLMGNGNCQELAAIAFACLYQSGIRPLDYMAFKKEGYGHAWVVIGREADATADLSTWGADAVWCDPWAGSGDGLVFSVRSFAEGLTHIEPACFYEGVAIPWMRSYRAGPLRNRLEAGNPTSLYRAGGV